MRTSEGRLPTSKLALQRGGMPYCLIAEGKPRLQDRISRGGGGEPMGKNGERILWGKHFRIGNFPHFSPLKKNFERRSVFFKMA